MKKVINNLYFINIGIVIILYISLYKNKISFKTKSKIYILLFLFLLKDKYIINKFSKVKLQDCNKFQKTYEQYIYLSNIIINEIQEHLTNQDTSPKKK